MVSILHLPQSQCIIKKKPLGKETLFHYEKNRKCISVSFPLLGSFTSEKEVQMKHEQVANPVRT
jgi:hypothetical protein